MPTNGIHTRGEFQTSKITAVYDRLLLKRAVDEQILDKWGMVRSIPAHSNTKKGFCFRYKNILPATTPLAEYKGNNIPAPNKIVREEVEFAVEHYGDHIKYNDRLPLYDLRGVGIIKTDFLDILGDQASLTVEVLRRDVLSAGNNVIYADGATDRADVAANKKKMTMNDFKLMGIKLKNQRGSKFKKMLTGTTKIGTQPIRSAFIYIASPSEIEDLRLLNKWRDVETYAAHGGLLPNEEGSIGDFRVIEYDLAKIVDVGGTNVHIGLAMAKDAYVTVTMRGHGGIRTIIKELGSAGSKDPFDMEGSISWQTITGTKIVNENWLIRTEKTASIEDSTQKHYYDYS